MRVVILGALRMRERTMAANMRWLWLMLADPDPPLNGQFMFSRGTARAVAETGIELHVVAFSMPGGVHRDGERTGRIQWHLAAHRPRSTWASMFSALPKDVYRTATRGLRRLVRAQLAAAQWDAVIFDAWSLGWALPLVREHCNAASAKLVYLAHNHEAAVARAVARGERRPLKRLFKRIDAVKAGRLECSLGRHATLIAADASEDCAAFRALFPDKPIAFVPPGYSGPRLASRQIASGTPRRAVLAGTFDWIPKRQSLAAFLAVADPLFARAGIELQIVGGIDPDFRQRLSRKTRATRFVGRVPDIGPYLHDARLGLVPDQVGGFKLKGLDYVFNRLPILALAGSLPGMPLEHGTNALFFADHAALAAGAIATIDNLPRLNALQENAYLACHDQFDWPQIGRRFVAAVERGADVPAAHPESSPGGVIAASTL